MNPQLSQQRSAVYAGASIARGVAVKISSTSTSPATVAAASAETDSLLGIAQAASNNGVVPVALPGSQGEMLLGATVAKDDLLTVTSLGKGTKAYAGDNVVAKALEAGSSGDYIAVEVLDEKLPDIGQVSYYADFADGLVLTDTTIDTGKFFPSDALITGVFAVSSVINCTGTVNMKLVGGSTDIIGDKQLEAEWGGCPDGFDWSSNIGAGSGLLVLLAAGGELKLVLSGGNSIEDGNLRVVVQYIRNR
jgi:hypothetical protein